MEFKYSFLNDELALEEIRKHKWIESEKAGKEIGFATAALDWIQKYGASWKEHRLYTQKTRDVFSERRHFRRFYQHFPVQLQINGTKIKTYTHDISLIGFSCIINETFSLDSKINVILNIKKSHQVTKNSRFRFKSKILRCNEILQQKVELKHSLFIPFSERVRAFFRTNVDYSVI